MYLNLKKKIMSSEMYRNKKYPTEPREALAEPSWKTPDLD